MSAETRVFAAVLLIAAVGCGPQSPEKRLVGTWAGKSVFGQDLELTFAKDGRFSVKFVKDGTVNPGRYWVDFTQKPAPISSTAAAASGRSWNSRTPIRWRSRRRGRAANLGPRSSGGIGRSFGASDALQQVFARRSSDLHNGWPS
jgi:hypothetical protein